MKILISGTPGTGKTKVAELLAKKLGYALIKVNDFAVENKLIVGEDKQRKTLIMDEKALRKKVERLKGNFVIEGHEAHFCNGDKTIILRTEPKELIKRLKAKKWPARKIQENIDAERMEVILEEARSLHNNIIVLDTTNKKAGQVVNQIIRNLK